MASGLASQTMQQALETAQCISSDSERSIALGRIAGRLAEQGGDENVSQAFDIVQGISTEWQKSLALKNIAAAITVKAHNCS